MRKKRIISVTEENERISKKNSLPYIKCALHLSCVVLGPIYGRFIGCAVNGFLSHICREKTVYSTTHLTAINRPKDHTREINTHLR